MFLPNRRPMRIAMASAMTMPSVEPIVTAQKRAGCTHLLRASQAPPTQPCSGGTGTSEIGDEGRAGVNRDGEGHNLRLVAEFGEEEGHRGRQHGAERDYPFSRPCCLFDCVAAQRPYAEADEEHAGDPRYEMQRKCAGA